MELYKWIITVFYFKFIIIPSGINMLILINIFIFKLLIK